MWRSPWRKRTRIGSSRLRLITPRRLASSLDEVIGSVDAVVVATPPGSHAALARQALSAGCHVLVEEPLAASVEDAEMLVELSNRASAF